jgi:hypothetical protein
MYVQITGTGGGILMGIIKELHAGKVFLFLPYEILYLIHSEKI